jgi:hypothetical protein
LLVLLPLELEPLPLPVPDEPVPEGLDELPDEPL